MVKDKTRKKRGSRTYGYGAGKKHRGRGSRGGGGGYGIGKQAKHKLFHTLKYIEEIKKKGFKPPQRKELRTINVMELDKLAKEFGTKAKDKIRLDLKKLGYDKVLGKGKIRKSLVVMAPRFSQKAKVKIEEVGGEVIVS